MENIILIFIILQIILFFLMTFHDWVNLPPLTNIPELEKIESKKGRLINSIILALLVLFPLTWVYRLNLPL